MTDNRINVAILYASDPLGEIIGGVESFIRGLIKTAPEDIRYHVVGATTDPVARPLFAWTECQLGNNSFMHYPLVPVAQPGLQARIPVTLSYIWAMLRRRPDLSRFQILETHRIEHFLFLRRHGHRLNMFMHQNMESLYDPQCDIRWKHAPWAYFRMEKGIFADTDSVFCVREDAVTAYRKRYPEWRDRFHFLPTWTDPEVFFDVDPAQRNSLRRQTLATYDLPQDALLLVNVGRIDHQKDPLLMIRALQEVCRQHPQSRLLWVGDGVLRSKVLEAAERAGLSNNLVLTGLMTPQQIANLNRCADLFVMSSAYEGMPIAVIEALACGLPVASTSVGELPRLVTPGVNGELCQPADAVGLTKAILDCIANRESYRGAPCRDAAAPYTPQQVLTPLYETYRKLAGTH